MDTITTVGVVAGAVVILATLLLALKKGLDQWTVLSLGIGALLIVGTKYTSFKIGTSGIEVLRAKIDSTASAADAIAVQTQKTSAAVQVTQTQVSNLAGLLEQRQVVPPNTFRPIRTQLEAAPKVDAQQLMRARETLARTRKL